MDAFKSRRIHLHCRRNPQTRPVQAPHQADKRRFFRSQTISTARVNKPEQERVNRVRARKLRVTHPQTSRNPGKIARIPISFPEYA